MRSIKAFFLTVLAFSMTTVVVPAPAQADLLISPLRVVFEGRDRSAEVTLINTSNKTHTYRVGWKAMVQTELGDYKEAGELEDGPFSLSEMVRFSPRQVTVEPDGKQRIRLSLRRPAEMPDGEFRGHMTFTRLPSATPSFDAPEKGQQLMLMLNMAFSIPVIVRSGPGSASAAIENLHFLSPDEYVNNMPTIGMTITRGGEFSAYGRLRVFHSAPGMAEQQVGLLNNVALFPEINTREVRVPLDVQSLDSGQLRIVYEGMGEYSGSVWDEETVSIGG